MNLLNRQTIFFCFCGPTASGKSTITRALKDRVDGLLLSTSTTTRAPRSGERHGEHYYFVDKITFERKVADGGFLEHATFAGEHYGTAIDNLQRAEDAEKDLLLNIEVQGVAQLKKLYPGRVVTVFVFPPSFTVLEQRFDIRAADSASRDLRMQTAEAELRTLNDRDFSDYLVINDVIEEAIDVSAAIVLAERAKFARVPAEEMAKLLGRK